MKKTIGLLSAALALTTAANAELMINALDTTSTINFSTGIAGVMGENYGAFGFDTGTFSRLARGSWAARVGTDYLTYNPDNTTATTGQYGFGATVDQLTGSIARGTSNTAGATAGMQASDLATHSTLSSQGRIFSFRTATNVPGAIYLKVENNTGGAVSQWSLGYQAFYINNTSVATNITAAYSLDGGASFTNLAALAVSSPGTGTVTSPVVNDWTAMSVNGGNPLSFNANVAQGNDIVFRWTFAGASNAESNRVGIDNIAITAIPEPGVFGLALLGLVLILRFRRK